MSLLRPSAGLLRRRDFLALGSLAAGAALVPGLAAAAGFAEQPLSVGFLEDSDRFENVFQLPWRDLPPKEREDRRVVPAEWLPSGDPAMAFRMVEIKIHGLYPAMPPRRFAEIDSTRFTAFYHLPWLGLTEPLPFHAWGASFGSRPTAGSPLRFRIPTREDGSLAMALDTLFANRRGGGTPGRFAADFTVDSWPGRPKLQRGIYFLALGANAFGAAFGRDQTIAANPETPRWDLLSLVMSVESVAEEEGEI